MFVHSSSGNSSDDESPEISCPADIVIDTLEDAVPVFWPPAVATDNVKVERIEYSIQNGSFFAALDEPEQIFAVVFDVFSNSESCFFTVTVNKIENMTTGRYGSLPCTF